MLIAAGIVSFILVIPIIYLAFSRKTGRLVRIAAFAALGSALLAVLVCSALLFILKEPAAGPAIVPGVSSVPPAASGSSVIPILVFITVMLLFIAILIVFSIREQKRRRGKN